MSAQNIRCTTGASLYPLADIESMTSDPESELMKIRGGSKFESENSLRNLNAKRWGGVKIRDSRSDAVKFVIVQRAKNQKYMGRSAENKKIQNNILEENIIFLQLVRIIFEIGQNYDRSGLLND